MIWPRTFADQNEIVCPLAWCAWADGGLQQPPGCRYLVREGLSRNVCGTALSSVLLSLLRARYLTEV